MKNSLIIIALALLSYSAVSAQGETRFGLTGGLLNTNVDFDFTLGNFSAQNNTGYYIGALVDIAATETLHIQPELTYGSAGNLGFVFLPVMAKYYVTDNFNIQAGPQLSFSTTLNDIKGKVRSAVEIIDSDYNGSIEGVLKNTGVDFGFGAGYEITDNFAIQGRYSLELSNRYTGPGSGLLKIRAQQIMVGIAYMF